MLAAYGVVYGAGPSYYLLALATLAPFLVIPAVLGSAFTLLLVNVFPARRTRDLLAVVALLSVAGVVALLRFVRPERLMRPEEFRNLVDFVAVLRTPSSTWLPSEWAADTLMGFLSGVFDPLPFLLLLYVVASILSWIQGYVINVIMVRAMYGLREQVEAKIHRLPLSHFDRTQRGELISRVTNDIDNITQTMQQSLSSALTSILTVIGVLVMMLSISWQLSLVALASPPEPASFGSISGRQAWSNAK